jgi:hypothetical protein
MDLIKEATMRKALTAAMAAITLAGGVLATAAPAQAQRWHDGGYRGDYGRHYDRRDNGGAAVAAGVVGLALGAALASNSHPYYGHSYYAAPYYGPAYGPAYGYGYGYQTCETTRWVWDPYIGRRVPVREAYAC